MFISNCIHSRAARSVCRDCGPVCVIICARNERDCIYETIQSVVRQQYPNEVRILCVDNGSSDGTAQEIERAKRDLENGERRIILISCVKPGKANALNKALYFADTRYIITVDADTVLAEGAMCALLGKISESGAGCVAGNILVFEPKTRVQKMQIYDYLVSIAAVKRYQGSYGSTLVAQGAFSAYETGVVKSLGGWTQGAGEDIVLTYQILGSGRESLYEPYALAYTRVPSSLRSLCKQRIRWARGMFEGLRTVRPWEQSSLCGGFFESINLSIIYLDLSYVFGFLVGLVLAVLGHYWFVGLQTIFLFPLMLIQIASVISFQKKLGFTIEQSAAGFIYFVLFFQLIQSCCSLIGYIQALIYRKLNWK